MKKTITFLVVLLVLNFNSFGQYNGEMSEKTTTNTETEQFKKWSLIQGEKISQRLINRTGIISTKRNIDNYKGLPVTLKQRLDSLISWDMDMSTSQWADQDKEAYTYDSNGNNTMLISSSRDDSISAWENGSKDELSYDANGNLIMGISFSWVDSLSQWKKEYKSGIQYDNNSVRLLDLLFSWNQSNSQWDSLYKTAYMYNTAGRLNEKISSYFNSTSNQWLLSSKDEFAYDNNGNAVQMVSSYWDAGTSQWQDNSKYEYTFDSNGNRIMSKYSYWSSNQWMVSDKDDYTYDSNGNMIEDLYSSWNTTTSQWEAGGKDVYSYNNTYAYSDLLLPYWTIGEEDMFNHQLTGYQSFEWVDSVSAFVQEEKGMLYYSGQNIVAVSESKYQLDIDVYPNPFTNTISFNIDGQYDEIILEVFDTRGQQLISKQILNHENIDTKNLSAGLYLYNLLIDGKPFTGKLVKTN